MNEKVNTGRKKQKNFLRQNVEIEYFDLEKNWIKISKKINFWRLK